MIVVMEGPSAAGKTTWCRTHCPDSVSENVSENLAAPDLYDEPQAVAHFWVEFNAKQWQTALQIEKQTGIACCDGDPLHLIFPGHSGKPARSPETFSTWNSPCMAAPSKKAGSVLPI